MEMEPSRADDFGATEHDYSSRSTAVARSGRGEKQWPDREPPHVVPVKTTRHNWGQWGPVGVGVAASLLAGLKLVLVASSVVFWGSTFSGEAMIAVTGCDWVDPRADGVSVGPMSQGLFRCEGTTVEGVNRTSPSIETRVVELRSARSMTDSLPADGASFEVFYDRDEPSIVYPVRTETVERARASLKVVLWGWILVGVIMWTAGYMQGVSRGSARQLPAVSDPGEGAYVYRSPLRSRGQLWLIVGVVLGAFDYWMIDGLMGTIGLG